MSKFFEYLNNIKLMQFPELRQAYDYDCGISCFQGVLFYYGFQPREYDLVKELNVDPEIGVEPAAIINAAPRFDLMAIGRENMTVDDLKRNIDNGVPTLLIVQAWPDETVDWVNEYEWSHYVVAIGYDDKNVYFEDPASTIRTWLAFEELNRRWHTYVDQERKAQHYGISIFGKESDYHRFKMEHMD
jgi:predicted double-glycine peptidase